MAVVSLPKTVATAPKETTLNPAGLGSLQSGGAGKTGTSEGAPTAAEQRHAFARAFPVAGTGWLGELAGGAAASADSSLTSYRLVPTVSAQASGSLSNYLHGSLRMGPGSAVFGEADFSPISVGEATSQMEANLATLEGLYPGGDIGATISTVAVGPSSDDFALDVALRFPTASSLAGHFGDIFDGLDSGLIGGPDLIEGLAITVSVDGTPVAGQWQAPLVGDGTNIFSPAVNAPSGYAPTVAFPNLTGGPTAEASVSGGLGQIGGVRGTGSSQPKSAANSPSGSEHEQ